MKGNVSLSTRASQTIVLVACLFLTGWIANWIVYGLGYLVFVSKSVAFPWEDVTTKYWTPFSYSPPRLSFHLLRWLIPLAVFALVVIRGMGWRRAALTAFGGGMLVVALFDLVHAWGRDHHLLSMSVYFGMNGLNLASVCLGTAAGAHYAGILSERMPERSPSW